MAIQYSIQKMVSDGTLSTIALGIQYLQRNDIYMRIAGEETPQVGAPSGYTWSFINNTTLKILPVVPNGVEVVVYRRTDVDAMYNVYSQNAQFDEATIDENNQQLLYIAQEYLEQGLPGAGVDTVEYVRDDGYFTYYRLRRTDGSYSDEFTAPSASNSTKVLTRESLRRSYAEAGYTLVVGSFEQGGTVATGTDVLLYEAEGKAYSWDGVLPKVVPAGETPSSTGGIAVGAWSNVGSVILRQQLAAPGGAGLITDTLKPVTWIGFAGGADKTGASDSAAALSAVYTGANSDGMGIIIPKGLYRVGNEVRDVGSDTIWLSRDFNSGVSATDTAKKTPLLITVGNPDEPVISSEYTRVGINITAMGRGAQHIDCIRASLINHSTDGQGNTAIYASASSVPGALWSAALHGETKHDGGTSIGMSSESASYTTGGSFYGAVLNNTTGTAAELHPTTGSPVVAHPQATALYITGGTTRGEMGQWVRGIRFSPLSMRANGTLIRDESSCSQGYWSLPESSKSNADILLEGTSPQGIIIQGTYSSGNAIRLKSGDAVAYEATGVIKTRYSSADVQWGLYNGATQRVGFATASFGMYFNGVKVVGTRQGSIPNATVGTEVTAINSILTAMRNHGLIAP